MPSSYRFPIRDSAGVPTNTVVEFEDMFVPKSFFDTNGLWSWGLNSNGQLGLGDSTSRSSPVQVGTLTNWKQVSGGYFHTAAVKTDGSLWLWGRNQYGELGLGDTTHRSSPVQVGTLTSWKQVSSSWRHTAAITFNDIT